MAEVLILAGESAWIQSRVLNADEICVNHASEKSPNTLVQIAFRPGRVPYDGGYGFANGIALAWVGDWRNRTQALEIEGISPGTIAEELIALWKKRGIDMQENVHGLMACVLWDESTGQLHAFRDKIGLIPMVYTMDPATRSIVVSSDADWLLEASRLPKVVNRSRVTKYLLRINDPGRDDFIQGLNRIRPSECLVWSEQQLSTKYYWNPETSYLPPANDYPRQFRELLIETLDSLGEHPRVYDLSGGLDSSSLVALAVEQNRENQSDSTIHTVSMIAPGHPRTDESVEIKEIVDFLKVDARYFSISNHWPLQNLDSFKEFTGMGPQYHPGGEHSRTYRQWISREYGDVYVISGVGSDQVLHCDSSNYFQYLISKSDCKTYLRLLVLARNAKFWQRVGLILLADKLSLKDALAKVRDRYKVQKPIRSSWRSPEQWVVGNLRSVGDERPSKHGLAKLQMKNRWEWELACREIHRKQLVTKTKARYPYFDDRVFSFCLRIPPPELRSNVDLKSLLRNAMKGLLPEQTLNRPKFSSFDSVVEQGIITEVAKEIVTDSEVVEKGFIYSDKFLSALSEYRQAYSRVNRHDLGSINIWSVFSLELWMTNLN